MSAFNACSSRPFSKESKGRLKICGRRQCVRAYFFVSPGKYTPNLILFCTSVTARKIASAANSNSRIRARCSGVAQFA